MNDKHEAAEDKCVAKCVENLCVDFEVQSTNDITDDHHQLNEEHGYQCGGDHELFVLFLLVEAQELLPAHEEGVGHPVELEIDEGDVLDILGCLFKSICPLDIALILYTLDLVVGGESQIVHFLDEAHVGQHLLLSFRFL